ncbi:MAG TPA: NAD(P)H-dependent oxidoreductase [Burkholderiales bacterium]|nr:NAD(P)H-dependent oxidoreductase [Burkholderiales bacterium]
MKTLLVVYHTRGVKTAQMAQALERGALAALKEADAEGEVRVVVKRCADAGPGDVLDADAIALGTPENFGYMSGMMKDFLERVFYDCEGKIEGRPWALFVSAGQDGSGAITSVERIVTGLRLRKVREPILALREVTPEILAQCEELGATLAVGIAAGAL